MVITTANGCLYPTLRGKLRMQVTRTNGTTLELTLLNVNYIPEIPVNLFSSSAAEEKGAFIDNRSHTMRKADTNTELYTLDKIGKQKFLKSCEVQVHMTLPAITSNQLEVWHKRLGHVGQEALQKTALMTVGMELISQEKLYTMCEACEVSKSVRTVSRKP